MNVKPYQPSMWKDYLLKPDKWSLFFIIVLLLVSGILIYFQGVANFDWASAVLGVIPVIPVLAIWWMEKKKRWTEALPSYLNVTLKDPERTIAHFEYIPIQNNIDIRQQAQTILGLICEQGRKIYTLETFIRPHKLKEGKVCKDSSNEIHCGQPFELKEVTLFMTKPAASKNPQNIAKEATKEQKVSPYDESVYLPKGELWYWCPIDNENRQLRPYRIVVEGANHPVEKSTYLNDATEKAQRVTPKVEPSPETEKEEKSL